MLKSQPWLCVCARGHDDDDHDDDCETTPLAWYAVAYVCVYIRSYTRQTILRSVQTQRPGQTSTSKQGRTGPRSDDAKGPCPVDHGTRRYGQQKDRADVAFRY